MNDYAIEVHGLTKRFGERTALADLDLTVPRRSVFGFLGPNGAGKTTLIRLLLGLTRPSEGSMRLLGAPLLEERGTALARVGAIVEEPHFHRFLTGRENLAITAAARGPEAHARIDDVFARVGLAEGRTIASRATPRHAPAAGRRSRTARRSRAPDPRRTDERARSGGDSRVPPMIRQFVEDGMTVLLSPARRGREGRRLRRHRRPWAGGPARLDRGPARGDRAHDSGVHERRVAGHGRARPGRRRLRGRKDAGRHPRHAASWPGRGGRRRRDHASTRGSGRRCPPRRADSRLSSSDSSKSRPDWG